MASKKKKKAKKSPAKESAATEEAPEVESSQEQEIVAEAGAVSRAIEALVFTAPTPMSPQRITKYLESANLPTDNVKEEIDALVDHYADRGIQLVKVGKSLQFRSNAKTGKIVEKLVEDKPARLSKSALEVLAIVAYKQPVTRAEIDAVRGTDSGHLMKGLLEKNLVRTDGHAEAAGRPLLYVTTPYFLEVFSLDSLDALPNLEEFQRELNSNAEEDAAILNADPDFESPLAAEPDRGAFDIVADEEVHHADFSSSDEEEEPAEEQLQLTESPANP